MVLDEQPQASSMRLRGFWWRFSVLDPVALYLYETNCEHPPLEQ